MHVSLLDCLQYFSLLFSYVFHLYPPAIQPCHIVLIALLSEMLYGVYLFRKIVSFIGGLQVEVEGLYRFLCGDADDELLRVDLFHFEQSVFDEVDSFIEKPLTVLVGMILYVHGIIYELLFWCIKIKT